jgi:hypothetical protein
LVQSPWQQYRLRTQSPKARTSISKASKPARRGSQTITAANASTTSITDDWSLLENQAALTNVDLIVKGTLNGQRHGLLYQPTNSTYRADSTNLGAFTHAQLLAKITNGDTLTFMGVPPGSGTRMGIDRNENGVLDGDEPPPSLHVAAASGSAVLNWPYSAAGFALEASTNLPALAWTNVPDPLVILSNQNYVTNSLDGRAKFYRLHFPAP